ncbi:MAG: M20/M25/M40 family metallo-hydrolase [Acutalibacteraceae bacterium]|nr:M20/M25/M40 family metallo-hydrolase [Acutalibacteraceae bacterium]
MGRDPLSGKIKDGKLYGRGACDDKYALATIMFIIKLLKEQGFKPKKNLLFAAYCDEEYGGSHGAMAAVMKYPTKRIVSMDGRYGQIWHCGSGGQEVKCHFHTDFPADSAKVAAKAISVVIDCIETFAKNRTCELEDNRFYKGTIIPETSLRYMGCRAGDNGQDMGRGEVHFVFYTDKTKEEIYAEFAELEKVIAEKLRPLKVIGDGFTPTTRFFHYVFCEPNSEDVKLMVESSIESAGVTPHVCGSCLSDLSVISKHGSSRACGFGAGRDFSEVGGAHQPNEFIELDKLVGFTKTIATYILKILG